MASTASSPASLHRRSELRDFLRSRRARLSPEQAGLPPSGRRRTPGLRREEVAVLAGVGVSWYTWLEQGRDITVSAQVLDAISLALQLDAAEREHLYLLAGLNPPQAEPESGGITPELQRLMDAWLPKPAYIRDRYWNFIAINGAARTVFGFGSTDRNCLVSFFTNSRYKNLHAHWTEAAPGVAARFRRDAARYPGDPEFARIISDVQAASPEFARLWARHAVSAPAQVVKAIDHPEAGSLVFEATLLPLPDHPGYQLALYNPTPDSGTAQRLEELMRRPRLAQVG